jgi:uracil-DNA glycosylase family 4
MTQIDYNAPQQLEAILRWYVENGVDESLVAEPVNRLREMVEQAPKQAVTPDMNKPMAEKIVLVPASIPVKAQAEIKAKAIEMAMAAQNIDELKDAINQFDGLQIKKTAMNMVFASGNPKANIMVIGDAPETDDDRTGIPFSGEVGQLADKMFGAIGLSRQAEEGSQAIYLTNIIPYRPPGNRSPQASEIEVSMPFVMRHIELVKPKFVFLMGLLAARSVLGNEETIAKMRGKIFAVQAGGYECQAMVSYHPSYLLRSPQKKREAWEDLQLLQAQFSKA